MLTLPLHVFRDIDRLAVDEFGMNSLVLMENAGRWVSQLVCETKKPAGLAVILCGSGNNGGDGMVIARHLDYFGWDVRLWLLGDATRLSPDCASNWEIVKRSDITYRVWHDTLDGEARLAEELHSASVIVDAMMGTGQTGSPREPFRIAVEQANHSSAFRVAVDVPTGFDANSGSLFPPTFQADMTCTFVAAKPGFGSTRVASVLGQLRIGSIGVPRKLVDRFSSSRI